MTTASAGERIELLTLELLAESDRPIGSPRVVERLANNGITMAEATAGRLLRDFDRRGLTQSFAKRGRILTADGAARLRRLRLLDKLNGHNAEMLRAIDVRDLDALLDLLYVRRALEPEAARLAALRATDEERDQIRAFAAEQVRAIDLGRQPNDAASRFHRAVAEASHNPMLGSIARVLLDSTNDPMGALLDAIGEQTGHHLTFAHDHFGIETAIRNGDAAAAEREMRTHIDELIADVELYRGRMLATSPAGADIFAEAAPTASATQESA